MIAAAPETRWTVVFADAGCERRLNQLRGNFAAENATVLISAEAPAGTVVMDPRGVTHHTCATADPDGALRAIAALRMGTAIPH